MNGYVERSARLRARRELDSRRCRLQRPPLARGQERLGRREERALGLDQPGFQGSLGHPQHRGRVGVREAFRKTRARCRPTMRGARTAVDGCSATANGCGATSNEPSARADGSSARADGSSARADGSSARADGSSARADGSSARANGSSARADGSSARADEPSASVTRRGASEKKVHGGKSELAFVDTYRSRAEQVAPTDPDGWARILPFLCPPLGERLVRHVHADRLTVRRRHTHNHWRH